jgi:peptidoglycan/xylan/chitin deacetylase (PgdA/CDA1 family)
MFINMLDWIFLLLLNIASNQVVRNNRLNILIYHRVLTVKDEYRGDVPDVDEFSSQMGWVAKFFNILTLSEAVALMGENALPKRALAITFDDGYKDNITNALPILKRYKLKATFFLTASYLEGEVPTWDYLTESIRQTKKKSVKALGETYDISSYSKKIEFALAVPEKLKALKDEELNENIDSITAEIGTVELDNLMMDYSDIQVLLESAMDIGSHSVDHKILTRITDEEARRQILDSKKYFLEQFNIKKLGYAYPNGLYPTDVNEKHLDMVTNAGYEYAVVTNIGSNSEEMDKYKLSRFTPWRQTKYTFIASLILNYFK